MIDGGVDPPLNLLLVGMNGPRNSLRIILGMLGQCLAIAWHGITYSRYWNEFIYIIVKLCENCCSFKVNTTEAL